MPYGDNCSGEQRSKEKTKTILSRGDKGSLTEEDI